MTGAVALMSRSRHSREHYWRNRQVFRKRTLAIMLECLDTLESYDLKPCDKYLKLSVTSHRYHDPPDSVRVEILKRSLLIASKHDRRVKYVRFDEFSNGVQVKVRFTTRPDERDLTQPGKWWQVAPPGRKMFLQERQRDPHFAIISKSFQA